MIGNLPLALANKFHGERAKRSGHREEVKHEQKTLAYLQNNEQRRTRMEHTTSQTTTEPEGPARPPTHRTRVGTEAKIAQNQKVQSKTLQVKKSYFKIYFA